MWVTIYGDRALRYVDCFRVILRLVLYASSGLGLVVSNVAIVIILIVCNNAYWLLTLIFLVALPF